MSRIDRRHRDTANRDRREPCVVILQDRMRGGGTERNSLWLRQAVEDSGLACRLLLFQPGEADRALSEHAATTVLGSNRLPPWMAPGLIARLRSEQASSVVCMGRNANAWGWWIKRRIPSIRLIATCRTNRRLPLPYRWTLRVADTCVANSQWAGNLLLANDWVRSERLQVIANPLIRENLFQVNRDRATMRRARLQLSLPTEGPIFCNVAQFVPGKNQETLLRILAPLLASEDALLVFVGSGPRRATCERLALRMGLDGRVRFFGQVSDVAPILAASDLFLSTALRESMPNALVEAQAAGVPVVAFDTAGTREAMEPGKSGFVTQRTDEVGFLQAIKYLMDDSTIRNQFSEYARIFAQLHFDSETIRLAWLRVVAAR